MSMLVTNHYCNRTTELSFITFPRLSYFQGLVIWWVSISGSGNWARWLRIALFPPYYCWFFALPTLRHWRWTQYNPPKSRQTYIDVTFQKRELFIITAMRTTNTTVKSLPCSCNETLFLCQYCLYYTLSEPRGTLHIRTLCVHMGHARGLWTRVFSLLLLLI